MQDFKFSTSQTCAGSLNVVSLQRNVRAVLQILIITWFLIQQQQQQQQQQ
jgi:hypothetical protein